MTTRRGCRRVIAAALLGAAAYLRHSETFAVGSLATLHGTSLASATDKMVTGQISVDRVNSLVPRRVTENSDRMPNLNLEGKVALVTGATRGIGAAIAEKLAHAGAIVIGTATTDKGAETISARFDGENIKGKGMKLDVSDLDAIQDTLKAIKNEYGTVDVLVNNAGITKDTLMMRMKDDDWSNVINTNLNSVFRMSKSVIKDMTKKRWGRIISVSSVVGSAGNPGQANYAASKAGINGFSRALAREVGSRGITVNSLAPGFIATDMTSGLKEEWKEQLLKNIPAGRLGHADEVADAVLWLAAPSSGYITGQTLHVNGGMFMS